MNPDHDFDHLEILEPTYLIKLVIGYKTYKTQLNISNINVDITLYDWS